MEVIHEYADKCTSSNKIKTIKFLHKESKSVLRFEDFLKNEARGRIDRVQSDHSDNLKGAKIRSEQEI